MTGARIWNKCTDFVVNSDLSPSGGFENYGSVSVNGSLSFTPLVTTLVNSGSISVAGDLALGFGARGGVFISGGIAPRIADRLAVMLAAALGRL